MGLIGPYGNRGERPKGRRRAAPLWSELDKGCGPLFLPPLPLFPPSPTPTRKEGVLLPVGVGLPLARLLPGRPHLPPCSFIYGGRGAPHMAKISMINCCVHGVPPAPVYKGGRGEVRSTPRGAPGGVLLPPGVGLPPLALLEKERGRRKEERGAPPPFLVLFGLGGGGARPALAGPPLLPHGPLRPINPREGSGNPPVFW